MIVVWSGAGEWVPLRAFEAGCDDFVRKPIAYLELRARVGAILRRTVSALAKSPRRGGALAIDPQRLEARYAGVRLDLSRLEFGLLCQLAADPLRVFTKRELLRDVWGTRRTRQRGRSTRTRAGCAASWSGRVRSATS